MAVVYEDASANQYPVKINGVRVGSKEELELNMAVGGIGNGETPKIRIVGDVAEMSVGDAVADCGDVSEVVIDSSGNYVLRGCGG